MLDPDSTPKSINKPTNEIGPIDPVNKKVITYMTMTDIISLLNISSRTLKRVLKYDSRFPKPCLVIGKTFRWKKCKIYDFLRNNVGIVLKTSE